MERSASTAGEANVCVASKASAALGNLAKGRSACSISRNLGGNFPSNCILQPRRQSSTARTPDDWPRSLARPGRPTFRTNAKAGRGPRQRAPQRSADNCSGVSQRWLCQASVLKSGSFGIRGALDMISAAPGRRKLPSRRRDNCITSRRCEEAVSSWLCQRSSSANIWNRFESPEKSNPSFIDGIGATTCISDPVLPLSSRKQCAGTLHRCCKPNVGQGSSCS